MTDPEAPLQSDSLAFVEALYADWLADPEAVSEDWQRYFEQLGADGQRGRDLQPQQAPPNVFGGHDQRFFERPAGGLSDAVLQERVDLLIRNYRVRGHMEAKLDPLGRERPGIPQLQPDFYGLTDADLDRRVSSEHFSGASTMTVREVLDALRQTYCRSIGAQFKHIDDLDARKWLRERMESSRNRIELGLEQQRRILRKLTDAVIFEEFIQRKFVGAKTFSLEGAESLIPLLDMAIEKASEQGVEAVVMGMAHRGRLNVLANIIGKAPAEIFREFEDRPEDAPEHGDVKYHLGYSNDWLSSTGRRVHLSLTFNPSHLEFVNPVVLGRVRAKQDRVEDFSRECTMGILIHGDAAFAGEGVVQETLNFSRLRGYQVGGTVHLIVNNQLGFTTSPEDSRSMPYASNVARMLQAPILLVNGEDPEAVAQVLEVAMEFRLNFGRDVVIDMYCYRRRGHNEGDEPSFTQPLLYQAIEQRATVREGYLERLLAMGSITQAEGDQIAEERRAALEVELSEAREHPHGPRGSWLNDLWLPYYGGPDSGVPEVDTGLPAGSPAYLLALCCDLPEGFTPHPRLQKFLLDARLEMAAGERPLDWAAAEMIALASFPLEGRPVRMSGQDAERATFSQRHSVFHDYHNGAIWMPLKHLRHGQARIEIWNSPLNEAGVLGYEYGYSLDCPNGLVVWEAQFGDFANAAQVIIDQFIVSAEDKWKRLSGLVLLLPHGFEGQGPEHSSARIERWLNLVAEDNVQVCQPSTPAQYFHLLRRQVLRPWRKPLVVFTPKSLLRHPQCVSTLTDLEAGGFQRVLPDPQADLASAERLLLCSGKVYYDLLERREKLGREDIPIVRLEQYYPLPDETLAAALKGYPEGREIVWVQDEPRNMGAWGFLRLRYGEQLLGRWPLSVVSRKESASPATGSHSRHAMEQNELLTAALGAVEA